MCKNLITLPSGVEVPCRKCVLCKDNYVEDWVGRARAEMEVSRHSLVATLTYGEDNVYGGAENNLNAKMLQYKHVADWLKLIRKWTNADWHGRFHPGTNVNRVRFLAVGEYGSRKGRAHWHVILFCEGEIPPNIRMSEPGAEPIRWMHKNQIGNDFWPHGWSQYQVADVGSVRYAIKYLTKGDFKAGEEKRCGISKFPPLGMEYFRRLAARHVDEGLSPQSFYYRFPDDIGRNGLPREYFLTGPSAYRFLDFFAYYWFQRHGNEKWPGSELMEAYEEERYERSQRGKLSWRDDGDWITAKKLERRGIWPGEIGEAVAKEKGVRRESPVRPFPPLEAYERG